LCILGKPRTEEEIEAELNENAPREESSAGKILGFLFFTSIFIGIWSQFFMK